MWLNDVPDYLSPSSYTFMPHCSVRMYFYGSSYVYLVAFPWNCCSFTSIVISYGNHNSNIITT